MQQSTTNENLPMHRVKEALVRGIIWTFIGLLYGALFVFFAVFAKHWDLPIDPVFLAGILSGTLGALIYSSMRLAVLMTVIISPLCIVYFIAAGKPVDPRYLLLLVSLAGAVVGALYGRFSMGSRVHRADAKTLAGFCAGWLVSLAYLLITSLAGSLSVTAVVALMCPITGILYVMLLPAFVKLYDNLLPAVGDGLMVGVGVSGFVAMSFFVMISSVDGSVAGPLLPAVQQIQQHLPGAIAGGMIGAGLAGIVSGLLLTEWQDL